MGVRLARMSAGPGSPYFFTRLWCGEQYSSDFRLREHPSTEHGSTAPGDLRN
jgi:hypothetical protein